MTNRLPLAFLASFVALQLVPTTPSAHAGSCIREAKQDFKDCKAACKESFQVTKDACLNRDHACVEVCRAKRAECREATGFDAAIHQCDEALAAARTTCRTQFPAGSTERDRCVDQVQVIAFQCRDAARELAKPALRQCRKDFRACAKACPQDGSPNPIPPRLCKLAAALAYRQCFATCREDFQVDKDACRNRDHACVEQCREERADCRQPIIQQLRSDIAACNPTRDAAVDNCKILFAEGTSERDQCIDNAQVEAFHCRDQAHETARPGLQGCREAFRTCATACPPTG